MTTVYAHHFDENFYSERINEATRFYYTKYSGHEADLTKQALADGATTILAAGGDGTMNKVLQEVYGHDVVFGIIPMSIGSSSARYLGISMKNESFIKLINDRHIVDVDILKVESENLGALYGLGTLGIGLTANVARELTLKDRTDPKRFWVRVIQVAKSMKLQKIKAKFNFHELDFRPFELMLINTDRNTGNVNLVPQASAFDGVIDIFTVTKKPPLSRFLIFVVKRLFNQKELALDYAETYKTECIEILAEEPLDIQIDSEHFLVDTPLTIKVMKHAQKILTPANFTKHLGV